MQNNDWMNMIENMNGIRLFSRSLIPRATKEHEKIGKLGLLVIK